MYCVKGGGSGVDVGGGVVADAEGSLLSSGSVDGISVDSADATGDSSTTCSDGVPVHAVKARTIISIERQIFLILIVKLSF